MCEILVKTQTKNLCGSCNYLMIKRLACIGGNCRLPGNNNIYKTRKEIACSNFKRKIYDDAKHNYFKDNSKFHKYSYLSI